MPFHTRALIDSVAKICCGIYGKGHVHVLFLMSAVKIAVLEFLIACLITPWPDGATASLLKEALNVAKRFQFDADWSVSTKAKCCLQLFSTLETPRSPPFLQVDRKVTQSELIPSNSQVEDASIILDRLESLENKSRKEDCDEDARSSRPKRKKDETLIAQDKNNLKYSKIEVDDVALHKKYITKKAEEKDIAAPNFKVDARNLAIKEQVEVAKQITEVADSPAKNKKEYLSKNVNEKNETNASNDELSNNDEANPGQEEEEEEDSEDQIPCIVDSGPDDC